MIVGACSHSKPAAKFNFVKNLEDAVRVPSRIRADLNVEALFAENRNQKVVHRRFVCALEDDHDFSLEHTIVRTFDGSMDVNNRSFGSIFITATKFNYRSA